MKRNHRIMVLLKKYEALRKGNKDLGFYSKPINRRHSKKNKRLGFDCKLGNIKKKKT